MLAITYAIVELVGIMGAALAIAVILWGQKSVLLVNNIIKVHEMLQGPQEKSGGKISIFT